MTTLLSAWAAFRDWRHVPSSARRGLVRCGGRFEIDSDAESRRRAYAWSQAGLRLGVGATLLAGLVALLGLGCFVAFTVADTGPGEFPANLVIGTMIMTGLLLLAVLLWVRAPLIIAGQVLRAAADAEPRRRPEPLHVESTGRWAAWIAIAVVLVVVTLASAVPDSLGSLGDAIGSLVMLALLGLLMRWLHGGYRPALQPDRSSPALTFNEAGVGIPYAGVSLPWSSITSVAASPDGHDIVFAVRNPSTVLLRATPPDPGRAKKLQKMLTKDSAVSVRTGSLAVDPVRLIAAARDYLAATRPDSA
jgi:hypothetical protein